MIVKLLTEHHLEFLSLTGGCIVSSESTHVKMPHCCKTHTTAHFIYCRSAMPCIGFKDMSSRLRSAGMNTVFHSKKTLISQDFF